MNITAVCLLLLRINSFRIRCCARQGRSLKDSGTPWVEYVEPRREEGVRCVVGNGWGSGRELEGSDSLPSDIRSGFVMYADGRRFRRCGGGEGVSVNIIEGPGPSSVATRVMGTGLLENLGWEACRERGGLSDPTDGGRVPEDSGCGDLGSLSEPALLPLSDDALSEFARLEIEEVFL